LVGCVRKEPVQLIPRGCTPNFEIVGSVPHSPFYRVGDFFLGMRMPLHD